MSTRCQIGVYEDAESTTPNVLIYRHTDGYPGGILDDIKDYVGQFMGARGPDPEYLAARLTWKICETVPGFLSAGVGGPDCWHGDIQFFYRVNGDSGNVECWKVPLDWAGNFEQAELIEAP